MAHTKSSGAAKYGRDSQPKYLGVKRGDGTRVKTGDIIIRQRGSKYFPGKSVKQGKDDTIYAMKEGVVRFTSKKRIRFDGTRRQISVVNVL